MDGVTVLQSQKICMLQMERQWIGLDEDKVRQKTFFSSPFKTGMSVIAKKVNVDPALEACTKSGVNCDDFSATSSNK